MGRYVDVSGSAWRDDARPRHHTPPVLTSQEDASLETAAQRMLEEEIACLPVVDAEGRLAGIVTHRDMLRSLRER